jgi:hypothetical protein
MTPAWMFFMSGRRHSASELLGRRKDADRTQRRGKARDGHSCASQRDADRKRIDVSQDYECRYWAKRFSVSPEELKRAATKVGPMVEDIARELGKAA